MKKKIARYKCLDCGYEFMDVPGPVGCIKCNPYDTPFTDTGCHIKWLNYSELFERENNNGS